MPNSVSAVLVIIAFLMPGFISSRVFSFACPTPESSDGRLFLGSITLSCVNYAVLSWFLVLVWTKNWFIFPWALATVAVFTLLVFPIVLGLALVKLTDSKWGKEVRIAFGIAHPVLKAWDCFFRQQGFPCWVIARLKGGKILAGFYGGRSFASSFPAAEDLYLEKICELSPDGKMTKTASKSLGAIIRMESVETLEFYEA